MNRLSSNNATVKLIPAKTPGQSIVRIENEKSKTWRARFGVDNSGQPSTKRFKNSETSKKSF